jgi:hypothetical protein
MTMIVHIQGTQPILLHKYFTKADKAHNDFTDYDSEWITGTHLNTDEEMDPADRFVVIPQDMIMGCLFNACKGEKLGKVFLTRVVSTSIKVKEIEYPLTYKNKLIKILDIKNNNWIDQRGAVVTGRRVDRSRTMIPKGWELKFELMTTGVFEDEKLLTRILTKAGTDAGLGDWRPSSPKKPGPYGTFELVTE